jgi:hypothetical protein
MVDLGGQDQELLLLFLDVSPGLKLFKSKNF